jgi:hypothetical protein
METCLKSFRVLAAFRLLVKFVLFLITFIITFINVEPIHAKSTEPTAPFHQSAFVIVTDVDDTIKVSHVLDPIRKVWRFFDEPVAFSGMSTLYNALMDQANRSGRDHGFAVVSGTPVLLEWAVWKFLETFQFPAPTFLSTRPIAKETFEFKSDEIAKLLDQKGLEGADVLLIGDDTEHDQRAYEFAKKNVGDLRSMNTQIFIRRVSGHAPNSGDAFAFDSAADIAVVQYAFGRLSANHLNQIFQEVETEQNLERLFVPGEYCPDDSAVRLSDDVRMAKVDSAVLLRLKKVENHLRRVCRDLPRWLLSN